MLTHIKVSGFPGEYYRSGIAGRFIMNGGCGRRCVVARLRPNSCFPIKMGFP